MFNIIQLKCFNSFHFLFSKNDISLQIKYIFNSSTESSTLNKKRKITDHSKIKSIVDYSQLKLPAFPFYHYLKTAGSNFINECQPA